MVKTRGALTYKVNTVKRHISRAEYAIGEYEKFEQGKSSQSPQMLNLRGQGIMGTITREHLLLAAASNVINGYDHGWETVMLMHQDYIGQAITAILKKDVYHLTGEVGERVEYLISNLNSYYNELGEIEKKIRNDAEDYPGDSTLGGLILRAFNLNLGEDEDFPDCGFVKRNHHFGYGLMRHVGNKISPLEKALDQVIYQEGDKRLTFGDYIRLRYPNLGRVLSILIPKPA